MDFTEYDDSEFGGELTLDELPADELVAIAQDEVPESVNLQKLQALQKQEDSILQQQEIAELHGEPIPTSLQERAEEIDEEIDNRRLGLVEDIKTHRDNVGGPLDDEVSDSEGNEDGPFGDD